MFEHTQTEQQDVEARAKREEIIRRYWMKGELTPLAIANSLAAQKEPALA